MKPDGYVAWRERALGVIAADRLDVRKWLLWAETQSQQIGEEKVKEKKGEVELVGSLAYVSQQVGSGAPKVFKTINLVFFIGFLCGCVNSFS